MESAQTFARLGSPVTVEQMEPQAEDVVFTPPCTPTDARLRTDARHIVARGDVNGVFPFTHAAGCGAGIALADVLVRLPRRVDHRKAPCRTCTDPEVAGAGLDQKRAAKRGAGVPRLGVGQSPRTTGH